MLKINLICLGDIKEKFYRDAISEYEKRIGRFAQIKIVELKENVARTDAEKDVLAALNKDAVEIKKHLTPYSICLDIDGQMFNSVAFAKHLEKLTLTNSEISFVIGASNGLSQEIKDLCKEKMSFSKMTFPHQLMRVIFLEQLYRAFTILNNITYHK